MRVSWQWQEAIPSIISEVSIWTTIAHLYRSAFISAALPYSGKRWQWKTLANRLFRQVLH